ncbi:carbamoyl-phosphate synthase small subunit [Eubacterium sp. An11]|nr:carbamoyl-phosphate synthase small subunit [Eubacterium sp. An11]
MDAILQLKKMGCETYAVAMAKDGPGADKADHFDIINVLDEERLEKYILNNQIDVVYSTGSDLAMPVASRLSEKLNLPHFVSSETAYICNHKNIMREKLTQDCKGNIPYQVLNSIQKVTVGFPAILKPSDAQGQRGIYLIHSQEEFEKYFESTRQFSKEKKVIIEKYVDGPEISVNGYIVNEELKYLIISDRETWPKYTGLIHKHIVPSRVVNEKNGKEIQDIIKNACHRVGIKNGPVYFQMKIEKGHPYIIEMTPRLDGCHMWNILEKATGVNLMKLVFEHLLYDKITELEKKWDIRPMELVFWCQEPHSYMNRTALKLPKDAIEYFYYYENGDYIRPVNGRYDKVGYYIRKL